MRIIILLPYLRGLIVLPQSLGHLSGSGYSCYYHHCQLFWYIAFNFIFAHIYFMNLDGHLTCFSPCFNFFLDYALLAKLINAVSSSFSHSSNFSFFFLLIIMLFSFHYLTSSQTCKKYLLSCQKVQVLC